MVVSVLVLLVVHTSEARCGQPVRRLSTSNSSLRNKRSGLSGRPPCKDVAIGVARRGAHLDGERTLCTPPSCSDLVSRADGPHVASFVVGRSSACV